ncbi:MAG TPA: VIT1/CCC1 transporter family protein [Acidimicrobiales bacterium]|nr:VIT1/CCC1 transporter family protein [Acidimicrobiales bacterium]
MADVSSKPARRERDLAPRPEHHHRDIDRGTARAAVFGVSDGLVSNVSLILGVAGANPGAGVVRLAGLAGLISGAVSMAAGEYVSMKAQTELFERELELERRELRRNPHVETVELTQIYQSRGVDPDRARELAEQMMRDPEMALQTHAREELGIDPDKLGSPTGAAISSFIAFALGALVPLLPWFFGSGVAATVASIALGGVACVVVGALLARFTGRRVWFSAARQLAIAMVAAGTTFLVGHLVGVGVS